MIDSVSSKSSRCMAIELKSSRQWRAEYASTINKLLDSGLPTRGLAEKPRQQAVPQRPGDRPPSLRLREAVYR